MFSLRLILTALLALSVAAEPIADVLPRANAPKNAPLATVYTKCKKANTVALTFDDGPYIYETNVTNTLKSHGIKGTFFVNGNNWACIYNAAYVSSLQAAYKAGHEILSHTWHHHNLSSLNWDTIHNEMWLTEQALQRILGVQPALMRPPYGEYNTLVRQAAHARNQSLVTWDFDSGDSVGKTAAQSNALYDQVAKAHPSNILTLNHEVFASTVNTVLPHAISVLAAKGYQFVTVSECLGVKPYQWTAKPQTRTSAWKC